MYPMTPEQIKKHEPMNINNLYEEVPVENDYDPIEYLPFGAIVTIDMYGNIIINSLLRPVTRESIEAFLREFGEAYGKSVLQSISDTFLKPDNLAKASFNDQPAIQAMGETIVNFPLPDITELIKQYTHPAPGDKQ